jgi:hypothetical protein
MGTKPIAKSFLRFSPKLQPNPICSPAEPFKLGWWLNFWEMGFQKYFDFLLALAFDVKKHWLDWLGHSSSFFIGKMIMF